MAFDRDDAERRLLALRRRQEEEKAAGPPFEKVVEALLLNTGLFVYPSADGVMLVEATDVTAEPMYRLKRKPSTGRVVADEKLGDVDWEKVTSSHAIRE